MYTYIESVVWNVKTTKLVTSKYFIPVVLVLQNDLDHHDDQQDPAMINTIDNMHWKHVIRSRVSYYQEYVKDIHQHQVVLYLQAVHLYQ